MKKILIAVCLVLLAVVLSGCQGGGAGQATNLGGDQAAAGVNANSCTADGSCEMNSATIVEGLSVGNDMDVNGDIDANAVNVNGVMTEKLTTNGNSQFNGDIKIGNSNTLKFINETGGGELLTISGDSIRSVLPSTSIVFGNSIKIGTTGSEGLIVGWSAVNVRSLKNESDGNAYVCVSKYGNLYRSTSPCR